MTEYDVIRIVKQTLEQQLAPTLMALVTSNSDQFRSSVQRFPSDAGMNNLRNIQPFGVASRAPAGTQALTTPINYDPTQINIVGHFDSSRPSMNDGETILYDAHGHVVYLSESKMQFGSKASANPMVLGDLLQTFLSNFLQQVIEHTHPAPGYPPTNASAFSELQSSPVNDGTLVSGKAFTEK